MKRPEHPFDVHSAKRYPPQKYTNVLIALMRYRSIPAAYITEYYFDSSYHAWAEVYLDDVGWLSVDPQGGVVGLSTRHLKLFRSSDFPAIETKLREIKIKAVALE